MFIQVKGFRPHSSVFGGHSRHEIEETKDENANANNSNDNYTKSYNSSADARLQHGEVNP